MRRLAVTACLCVIGLLLCAAGVRAGSSETYIKQLEDQDPAVRANAAYELSCG